MSVERANENTEPVRSATLVPGSHKDVRGYWQAGRFFPSVGACLDLLFPSAMSWIDEKYLEEGTRCHEEMKRTIDQAMKYHEETGHWFWPTSDNPRVNALIQTLAEWKFIPLEAEHPRCSYHYGYAGTPDALMTRSDLYVVPDWKFSESIEERYEYQLESYLPFFTHLQPRPALMLFQVTREAKVKPIVVKPRAIHWAEFLAAMTVLKKRLR